MDARSFNLRRATMERQKAVRAFTEEARQMHLELAAIFEGRAAALQGPVSAQ